MRKIVGGLAALCLVIAAPQAAFAWGAVGHRTITKGAYYDLPVDLQAMLNPYLSSLVYNSSIEPPNKHFINIDSYSEFVDSGYNTASFPRDESVLIAKYGSSVVTENGEVPWTANTYLSTLTAQMASAKTAADWAITLSTAADLAHYIEDMHNPMHLATNYDGRLTNQAGLHARYESTMVSTYVANLTPAVETNLVVFGADGNEDFLDAVFDRINIDYPKNAVILAADKQFTGKTYSSSDYYTNMFGTLKSITQDSFDDAANMVASAWYTAWVDAGSPVIPAAPEPASLGLLVVAGVGLLLRRR